MSPAAVRRQAHSLAFPLANTNRDPGLPGRGPLRAAGARPSRTGLRPGSIWQSPATARPLSIKPDPDRNNFRPARKTTSHETSFPIRLDPEPRAARPVALAVAASPPPVANGDRQEMLPQVSGTGNEGDKIMNETQLTITGNLLDDPELRYTPSGQPVVRFRVASTPRFYDKARERMARRGKSLPDLPGVAPGRRARGGEPQPGHPGDRGRTASPEVL